MSMAEPERIEAGSTALIAYDVCRRALTPENPERRQAMRPVLRSHGLLTRDSRMKERKKPGLKRARKAPQYTKR